MDERPVKNGNEDRLQQVTEQLQHTWLTWGLLPLAACVLLTLLVALVVAHSTMSERQAELRFQIIFAISAGLFLIAFSLDSHWTSAPKLARRIARAAGLDDTAPKQRERRKQDRKRLAAALAPQSEVAFQCIHSSMLALTLIGGAIGITAILAAAAHLGAGYATIILILAASYQLFVFSRHTYYKEVLQAAEAGQLVIEPKGKKGQQG